MWDPWIAPIVAVCAIVYSLVLAYQGWGASLPKDGSSWPRVKKKQVVVLVGWMLVPPLWFCIEYFLIFKPGAASHNPAEFELFKYGQDVSSRAWVAIASTLLVLYFGKEMRG